MASRMVEKLGHFISDQVPSHPQRARRLLSTAYRVVEFQMKHLPPKKVLPARNYMQSVTARSMSMALSRPDRAACVNIFLPCEILHAMGIPPMFPEGLSCYLVSTAAERVFIEAAEEAGVPESFCSYHKILIGLAESGVLSRPRFIVNTSLACDANQLSFRRAAAYWGVPRFTVDVPHVYSDAAVADVADQLRAMACFVQEQTGRKLEEDKLRQAVARSQRTVELYRRYLTLRATRHLSDEMTSEMTSVFATHVMLGSAEAERYAEQLVTQVSALPNGFHGKRLLWLHTLPHWQQSMREILNFNSRVEIVACDMSTDNLSNMEPDQPYESMARRLLENTFNGGVARRIDSALELARQMRADGVVYFCHWGCKQTTGGAGYAKKTLEAAGYPTLILDGDGCDSGNVNDGQMVTRLQAFLEQLEGRV